MDMALGIPRGCFCLNSFIQGDLPALPPSRPSHPTRPGGLTCLMGYFQVFLQAAERGKGDMECEKKRTGVMS